MDGLVIGMEVKVDQHFIYDEDVENTELPSVDFYGWTGVIRQFYDGEEDSAEGIAHLEWSAETLGRIPESYLLRMYDAGEPWSSAYLPISALKPADIRFNKLETEWEKNGKSARIFWESLEREGRLIARAFENPVDRQRVSPMECWLQYLDNKLIFPVKAKIGYLNEGDENFLIENDPVLINGLMGWDYPIGIFCSVESNGREYIIPLLDVDVSTFRAKNSRYITAYQIWMYCNY